MNLRGRNFLTLKDFTSEEINYLLDLSAQLKEKKKKNIAVDTLRGKNVALIFEKTSTRTRCAFEVAAHDLGMGTTYLDPSDPRLVKRRASKTLPAFWDVCLMGSNTGDTDRKLWKSWQNMQVFRSGMV